MKYSLFYSIGLLLLVAALANFADAACPTLTLPTKFEAEEKLLSIGTDVELVAGSKKIGDIEERTLNFTPTFELFNEKGQKIARAKERFFSWGTTIDVVDCEGKAIGTVKELIWESFFKVSTQYEIRQPNGALIATSEKKEFFSTDFTVSNTSGQAAFQMHRPTFNWFSDTWHVTTVKAGIVDPRLVIMIPAFKTAADNRRREEESDDE